MTATVPLFSGQVYYKLPEVEIEDISFRLPSTLLHLQLTTCQGLGDHSRKAQNQPPDDHITKSADMQALLKDRTPPAAHPPTTSQVSRTSHTIYMRRMGLN